MRKYYTILESDIGRPQIRAFNKLWPVSDFIGHIAPYDIGKRVYNFGHFIQVENDDQRKQRWGRQASQQSNILMLPEVHNA